MFNIRKVRERRLQGQQRTTDFQNKVDNLSRDSVITWRFDASNNELVGTTTQVDGTECRRFVICSHKPNEFITEPFALHEYTIAGWSRPVAFAVTVDECKRYAARAVLLLEETVQQLRAGATQENS